MTMSKEYKYDVAFSFLEQDEQIARNLSDLFEGRLTSFIYSKKQEDIAGTDGEETLNRVFGEEARIVVVLFRPAWGSTSWTRIEQTAIQNRHFEDGYDFVTLVMLEKETQPPKWLPKNRIWVGFERVGLEATAAVIEARVQEAGGAVREETIKDKAQRLDREVNWDREKKEFLGSSNGVNAAKAEIENLFNKLEIIASDISGATSQFKFSTQRDSHNFIVNSKDYYAVRINWSLEYGNTLNGSRLTVALYKGQLSLRGGIYIENPTHLDTKIFYFDADRIGQYGWLRKNSSAPICSTQQLAESCMTMLMERLKKETADASRR